MCFNDILRILAAFSAELGSVAIYAWDDQFVRYNEHCAPIALASYRLRYLAGAAFCPRISHAFLRM